MFNEPVGLFPVYPHVAVPADTSETAAAANKENELRHSRPEEWVEIKMVFSPDG